MHIRKATARDFDGIWPIIVQTRNEMLRLGRKQWDEHYPAPDDIHRDINTERAYIILEAGRPVAYAAFTFDKEEAYAHLAGGQWISEGDYGVIHRLAIAIEGRRKGYGRSFFDFFEQKALRQGITSIKVDTNFDNVEMLGLLDKLGYQRCGLVYYPALPTGRKERIAFEKCLTV